MQTIYLICLALPLLLLMFGKNKQWFEGAALLLAVSYLGGGFFALMSALPVVGEVAFICSGFVMGNCLGPKVDRAPGLMLGLGLMAVQLLVATLVIFSMPISLLTFILGMSVAFGFGQVIGMLLRSTGKKEMPTL
jgi:hypothetical protein